ncbi:LuxR C-terminal-related transcriptional regulator [Flavobacteriaceae bacterium GSB9]|nr:LuxR C-terminal-related transcriptional regulator [Flavobacteriaceae bacterium GSB9]
MTKKKGIDKVMSVWKAQNKILLPGKRQDIKQIVNELARLFSHSSFYYLIMNFDIADIDYVSEGVCDVLGISPEKMNLEKFLSLMHPDDLDKMHQKERTSLSFKLNKIPKEDITKYKTVYLMRLRHADGSYRTILHQSKAFTVSEDGKVFQTICVHNDITHLNPVIDHKISFISQECPSYYALDTETELTLIQNSFKELFTKREKEVVNLILQGKSTKQIATLLFISIQTVNCHKKNILKKSHCKNTSDLISTCIKEGFI